MTLTSQQYAALADDSYSEEYRAGVFPPDQAPEFVYEGVVFKVLEHADNKLNGYQGNIYQRIDTGEIVVAHRGTEQIMRDAVMVDGSMVLLRANQQAEDAIELTQRALEYARDIGSKPGKQTPEVTVTGHSLGGTDAQISGHHFGLRGETFNAYGAASLGRRIPEGGNTMVNHVMATDVVSAASPHFGQVRIYATPEEIQRLAGPGGYANNTSQFDHRSPLVVAGMSFGAHSMHNFMNVDGERQPDMSVLNPQAQHLAQTFAPMIEKYRGDVETMRSGVTVMARDPVGRVKDVIDYARGPLPAGEPAARAEQAAAAQAELAQRRAEYHEQRQQFFRQPLPPIDPTAQPPDLLRRPETQGPLEGVRPYHLPDYPGTAPSPQAAPDADETVRVTPMREHEAAQPMPASPAPTPQPVRSGAPAAPTAQPQAQTAPPPVPEHLRDFRHPDHPLHTRYTETLAAVHALEDQRGMPHGGNSEQLAAALLAKLDTTRWAGEKDGRAHFGPVGTVELRGQGAATEAVVVERRDYYHLPARQLGVPVDQALRPVEHTADAWARQKLPHLDAPADAALPQTTRPMPEQLPAYDPRHPAHAGHRGYQQLRGQVADTYAQAGIALSEDQLERATAAVSLSNRQKAVPQADLLVLLPDRASGTYGPDSTLVVQYGGNAAVPLRSETTAQQMQRPAEETYQQLQQVDQQLALEQRQREQQREQAQAHGSGMAMT